MHKLKLISLLKKLDKKEIAAFHKHLKQNHGGEKIALQVFDYLRGLYPKLDDKEKISAHVAYEKIFNTPYHTDPNAQKKLLNTASELFLWLKQFLIAEKARKDELANQALWLSILKEKGLKKAYHKELNAFYESTQKAKFEKADDAIPHWIAGHFYWDYLSAQPPLKNLKEVQTCAELMNACTEIQRLKLACVQSMIKKFDHTTANGPTQITTGYHLLHAVYDALWRMTDTGSESDFIQLESLLKIHGAMIDPAELYYIVRYVHAYCAAQSRKKGATREIFKRAHLMDRVGLDFGVYGQNGEIASTTFGNIVTIACQASESNWAESFIKNHSNLLPKANREDSLILVQALLANEKREPQKVIQLLENVEFKVLLDQMRSKILLIRNRYEIGDDPDKVLEVCYQLEQLMRRSTSSDATKATLKYVLIVKMLLAQKSTKQLIVKRIEEAKHLYLPDWLLEKTANYKARYAARNPEK